MEKEEINREKIIDYNRIIFAGIFIASALFYLFWYWKDGIILTPDADSYIQMTSDREPGYCSFLWVLRVLFGNDRYLPIAVILQCLIAAVAAAVLTYTLWKWFALHWVCAAAILVIQYGITLLNRFVAQRRYSYYNSIETEGLAYSFWIFFFLSILGILYKKDKKSIVLSMVWSVVLISIRKQMLVTLGLVFLCLLYVWWREKKGVRAVIYALAVIFLCLAGTKVIDCSYNYMKRGVFASHTGDSTFILGTEIYLADNSMAEHIKEEETKALFLEIMERAAQKEYHVSFAKKGWQALEDHYSQSYDRIKFDVVSVVIREKYESSNSADRSWETYYNEITGKLVRDLLVPCLPNLCRLFCANVIHGMVTTVLKVHPVLNWAALFLYILYSSLIYWLIKKKSYKILEISALPFAVLVLFAIAGNVALTSATIYCQMRYMLYNTALFYQAGVLMLVDAYRVVMRQGKKG